VAQIEANDCSSSATAGPRIAVDREELSVIAREPAEGRGGVRRIVRAHVDPARAQARPETRGRLAEAPQPVVQDAHPDARPRALEQRLRETLAGRVAADDVVLQAHALAGRADRLEPRRVVLRRVAQQAHAVALDQVRARSPGERLIRQRADGVGAMGDARPRDARLRSRAHAACFFTHSA
jgi:hypothetical protein